MARLVSLAFLLIPLIEIACFILIGQAIGLWPTLLGVLLTAIAGSILVRVQGRNLLSDMRSAMSAVMPKEAAPRKKRVTAAPSSVRHET